TDNPVTVTDRKQQVSRYQYDALDRVSTITYADNSTIRFVYDAGDRATQIVDSASGTITRTYDGFDRILSETTPQGSVTYNYDVEGKRTDMTVGGQTTVSYAYD